MHARTHAHTHTHTHIQLVQHKNKSVEITRPKVLMYLRVLFSSPEPQAWDELIGWDSSHVCPSVPASTLQNMNISETRWPIAIKFHFEHNWGERLTALGFGPDRTRTLLSMETDSSHRVIIGKIW